MSRGVFEHDVNGPASGWSAARPRVTGRLDWLDAEGKSLESITKPLTATDAHPATA